MGKKRKEKEPPKEPFVPYRVRVVLRVAVSEALAAAAAFLGKTPEEYITHVCTQACEEIE